MSPFAVQVNILKDSRNLKRNETIYKTETESLRNLTTVARGKNWGEG